ncbi:MAG: hypothetical protein AB8B92_07860 [Gammaproteobacteria bacterium]
MSDNTSAKGSIKKLIFYNNKNKTILIIEGVILHDKFEAIVYLKPHMVLYGVVKMICINEDGSKSKYEVIGIDKLDNENYKNESTAPYKIYLSKNYT